MKMLMTSTSRTIPEQVVDITLEEIVQRVMQDYDDFVIRAPHNFHGSKEGPESLPVLELYDDYRE